MRIATVAVIILAAALVFRCYSVRRWERFEALADAYVLAAARGDSATLAASSAGPEPVRWALLARRNHPAFFDQALLRLDPIHGEVHGDSARVKFATSADVCRGPLELDQLQFVFIRDGRSRRWLVLRAGVVPC
ncbi:MAG: hypothetical protein ACRENI_08320 [Gemmatimonadaceae bacterium]